MKGIERLQWTKSYCVLFVWNWNTTIRSGKNQKNSVCSEKWIELFVCESKRSWFALSLAHLPFHHEIREKRTPITLTQITSLLSFGSIHWDGYEYLAILSALDWCIANSNWHERSQSGYCWKVFPTIRVSHLLHQWTIFYIHLLFAEGTIVFLWKQCENIQHSLADSLLFGIAQLLFYCEYMNICYILPPTEESTLCISSFTNFVEYKPMFWLANSMYNFERFMRVNYVCDIDSDQISYTLLLSIEMNKQPIFG